ncbi:diguanylate cyclase/phosphodiesterase with PAS/PAC and GAF sensor(s) [Nostoc sp. NIES-3756]|uniref:putative bifunctional diguanylate cyclase/phosphodiesterase n=1 Tax=Nostoc sp. NIES-3756 TaxID=1751286 RepID=UPI000722FEDB|nr:EAL domain-containing protein [Nostoc sp. NIES-3756]BAT51715.1 diguanylate cyclase/phosphodiesterase with PAS/PAC and GAF sensor(s) [Nostoc sp. NIES-3756]
MPIYPFKRNLINVLNNASKLISIFITLLGCAVLLGWYFDISVLKSISQEWAAMKPNTALGFVLSGLALNLIHSTKKNQRRIAQVLATAIALLGVLTLSQYLFGWNWGIDQLLFSHQLKTMTQSSKQLATTYPGRMSPVSALNFSLIGCALWLSASRSIHYRLMQLLAFVTSLTSLQVVIGYVYGVKPLVGLSSLTQTAIHTGLTFFLLSVAILLIAPFEGFIALIISDSVGGMTARMLLPAAIAIPFSLGCLALLGEKMAWFDYAFGLSLHVTGNVAAFMGLIWYYAKGLDSLDIKRKKIEEALRIAYASEALHQSETRFRRAIFDAPLPMMLHAEDGEVLLMNHVWSDITGYSIDEIQTIGDWTQKAYGERREQVQLEMNRLYSLDRRIAEGEYTIKISSGETRVWDFHSAPLGKLPDGRSLVISTAFDVTQRKQTEAQLRQNAFYDGLTGLANRALFMEHLQHALQQAKRQKDYLFAVLFLDLDRFKVINDSLGHIKGDQFLITIAQRLGLCIRATDIAARLGGDEFTILLEDIQDVSDAIKVAERIQQELKLPLNLDGQEVFTSASIGIALSSTINYDHPEQLLRDADTAMYRAKALGKSRYALFNRDMYANALARLQLEADLRRALARQEFQVYYQPIVSLVSGDIVGFEALLRWQHPERGLLNPVDFVSLAEETGLIVEIGYWVLCEACRQMQAWQVSHPHSSLRKMSVNLCAKQFSQPNLIEQIRQIIQSTGLDASALALEITEGVIAENGDEATATLLQLRELGIEILIDDFGTGYSSLGRLYSFPVSVLKIDRSFVNPMTSDNRNLEIIEIIIALAHKLGMTAIAEGVETQEQVTLLSKLGCESVQGYFFSRPLPSSEAGMLIS